MKTRNRIIALVIAMALTVLMLASCGSATIEINDDGYWVINGEVTDVKAAGTDGKDGADGKDGVNGKDGTNGIDGTTPTVEINEEGYWVINGTATEIKAAGADGKDGAAGAAGKDGKDGATPTIEINSDGYWVINGTVTEYKAAGSGETGGNNITFYLVTVDDSIVGAYPANSLISVPNYKAPEGRKLVGWKYLDEDWDFYTDKITRNMRLYPVLEIDAAPLAVENVKSETLKSIVPGKIKQMDQAILDDGSNNHANGYFTKEGGTPVYVAIEKDGVETEALYFSRDDQYDWTSYNNGIQNYGWAEHRYALDKTKKLVSIKFDYLITGTVESSIEQSTSDITGAAGPLGSGIVQLKTATGVYDNAVIGDETYIIDSQWHTMELIIENPVEIENLLIKLYHFNGEFLIANLEITYE